LKKITVSEYAQAAARKMRNKKTSSLVVVDRKKGGDFLGIMTERDLLYRIYAEGTSGKDVRVQEIMSSPIATIDPP